MRPAGGRTGGTLFPVLILVGILFLMSTMLPQLLVQASGAIRIDHRRDELDRTLDSAVAFAEAKLKQDLSSIVASGEAAAGLAGGGGSTTTVGSAGAASKGAPAAGWAVRPSYDNPDYGPKKPYDFEVKCQRISLWKMEPSPAGTDEVYRFTYVLDAGAWDQAHALNRHAEITGVATVTATPGKGLRVVNDVKLEAMNRDKSAPYVAAAKS